jgi:Flp pilus assembly protein TadD
MTKPSRVALGATLVVGLLVSGPATGLAQVSRVSGTVKDENGDPVRGATVVAENENLSPSRLTAVTDAKGRYGMLGLRSGTWTFQASAPGFLTAKGSASVRGFGSSPPIDFRIVRESVAAPGALGRVDLEALQADLTAAEDLMATGKYPDAVARYEAILKQVPALTTVNLQIGRACRAAGQLNEALVAFERAATAEPPIERAIVEAGLTEIALGRVDAAEARIAPLAEGKDASREALYGLGEVKFARGDLEAAAEWYERAVAADPAWATPHLKLGVTAARRGDAATAVQHLEQVVALDPDSPEAVEAKALLERLRRG